MRGLEGTKRDGYNYILLYTHRKFSKIMENLKIIK